MSGVDVSDVKRVCRSVHRGTRASAHALPWRRGPRASQQSSGRPLPRDVARRERLRDIPRRRRPALLPRRPPQLRPALPLDRRRALPDDHPLPPGPPLGATRAVARDAAPPRPLCAVVQPAAPALRASLRGPLHGALDRRRGLPSRRLPLRRRESGPGRRHRGGRRVALGVHPLPRGRRPRRGRVSAPACARRTSRPRSRTPAPAPARAAGRAPPPEPPPARASPRGRRARARPPARAGRGRSRR